MSPTKIPRASSQFMMPLCSICPTGSLPCSEKQPTSFHSPTRPSLITPCYSSGLISFSFSHSLHSRHTGLRLQGLCTRCSYLICVVCSFTSTAMFSMRPALTTWFCTLPTSYLPSLFCLSPSHLPHFDPVCS